MWKTVILSFSLWITLGVECNEPSKECVFLDHYYSLMETEELGELTESAVYLITKNSDGCTVMYSVVNKIDLESDPVFAKGDIYYHKGRVLIIAEEDLAQKFGECEELLLYDGSDVEQILSKMLNHEDLTYFTGKLPVLSSCEI